MGCLKNNIEFFLFGQFSVPLSFLNLPIIISLLTQLRVKLALQVYKNGRHELLNEVEETASVVYKDILDWIQQKLPWTVLGPRAHESRLIFETA